MNDTPKARADQLSRGTLYVVLAESLFFPAALIITVLLTRWLGPRNYGLYVLSAGLIFWTEWSLGSLYSRPTIKFIAEASDWRLTAAKAVRLHLLAGILFAAFIWLAAPLIAGLLGEEDLTGYLRLFAVDIPLFSLVNAYRNILVGLSRFKERSFLSVGHWLARVGLTILLLLAGYEIRGAILAWIGATVIQLLIARFFVKPPFWARSAQPLPGWSNYIAPLFLSSLCFVLYRRADLFFLQYLQHKPAITGIYGAAQNLAIAAGTLILAFVPLLLSMLSRLLQDRNLLAAKEMAGEAIRLSIRTLPFAGMIAGSSTEIILLIFGPAYSDAAPALSLLIFATVAFLIIATSGAILVAAEKPFWPLILTGPLLPLSIAGHLFFIPRFGIVGAASVTLALGAVAALFILLMIHRLWEISPPVLTFLKSLLACAVAFFIAWLWPTPGFLVCLKLPAITLLIFLVFISLREFRGSEIAFVQSLFDRRIPPTEEEMEV